MSEFFRPGEKELGIVGTTNQESQMDLDLKELMRLCYNSGLEDVDGFDSWWEELGEDRHNDFIKAGADPEILETLQGLLRTLNTVIETANKKGGDFVEGTNMKWGAAAKELIEKLDVG